MDHNYIKDKRVIERYLLGQLSQEELDQFSFQLMKDPELQQEVNANKLLFKTLWKANQVDSTTSTSSNTSSNKILWVAIAALMIVAVYFLIPSSENTNTQDNQEPTTEQPTEIIPIEGKEFSPEEEQASEPNDQKEEETAIPKSNKNTQNSKPKTQNSKPKTQTPKPKTPSPPPIAANFEILEDWEKYISATGSLSRGSDYELELSSPSQVSQAILKDGTFDLNMNGKIIPTAGYDPTDFKLRFFTNKEEDFKKNQPIHTFQLDLKKENEDFIFNLNEKVSLEPGLYYFRIDDDETGEKYLVGKVVLNKK